MLDFPATAVALWALSDAGGPRPEYMLPVLYEESGFSPGAVNSIGCTGLNQLCPFAQNIPEGYASWLASQQIAGPIASMFKAIVAKYGPIGSGTRAYQANFLPGTLATDRELSSVLATKGSSVYAANTGLDYSGSGAIRVSDLAHAIAKAAATPAVRSAIAQTYALRPGDSPNDPVYGTDFLSPLAPTPLATAFLVGSATLAAGAVGAFYVTHGRLPLLGRRS
jgi:hypothetical protein